MLSARLAAAAARAAVGAILLLAAARPAAANEYEIYINIETEEDLYDLFEQEEIGQETFDTLLELYQRGVDLNRAGRAELYTLPNLTYADVDAILAYRDEVGVIRDPSELVIQDILSQDKLGAIAAFLLLRDPGAPALGVDGWFRAQTRGSVEDGRSDRLPPMALQARVATLDHLRAGFAATVTRNRVGDVVYDPTRNALVATPEATRAHLPKVYVAWETDEYAFIAGTYRIGFGQRLTFDNTGQISPNGFYRDDELFRASNLVRLCKESAGELMDTPCPRGGGSLGDVFITPDYRWRSGLLGVAAGLKKVEIGSGHLQTYGFFSYEPRSIYQYEIYDRGRCEDPRADDPDCSAPQVFRDQQDPFEPTSRFSFHTLPDMYTELTVGANTTYFASRRVHVGATGYGSRVNWLTRGIDLDFQEWSRFPFGGPWGAVGMDGGYGIGKTNLFAEVTRSFDSQPDGGGGFAGIVRSVTSFSRRNELEASLRYYDTKFANPYARPIAAADQFEGNRARDEAGARVRYTGRISDRISLRTNLDTWQNPSERRVSDRALAGWGILAYVLGDVDMTPEIRWGLWSQFQDKDLGRSGRGQCFSVSIEEDERGEPIPCGGQKLTNTVRLRYEPNRTWFVTSQLQHSFQDEAASGSRPQFDDIYRQDLSATVIWTARPVDPVRVRVRSRYLFQDIKDNDHLEQSWWNYVDVTYRLRQRDRLRMRYDIYVHLDDRSATMNRVPSPEHWLWLEYESRF